MSDREIEQLADIIRATPIAAPGSPERERDLLRLRAASPKRAGPGRVGADQADAADLPLFIAGNEPGLF